MPRRTGHLTPLAITRLKRIALMRKDMLNGLTNQAQLAIRHGVSISTTHKDVHTILREMNEESKELGKREFALSLHRLEDNIKEASMAWERSKENKEEIRTEYQKRKCQDCQGTGIEDGEEDGEEWCVRCEGKGEYIEEVVTTKVTGQAGDVSFLKERRECIKFKLFLCV